MRELIYVPIVHTETDMGSLSESAKKEYLAKYGKGRWEQHVRVINDMWEGLRQKIFSLDPPYKMLRIYQDGLPVCGKELEIVREVAGKGSQNHKIVSELVEKGAKLEGTEDPKLLLEEYNNLKRLYQISSPQEKLKATQDYKQTAEQLLMKRDKFIANRIDSTLLEHEIGLLFMGMQHSVDKYLKGIKISYLIHRLPFKEDYKTTLYKSK